MTATASLAQKKPETKPQPLPKASVVKNQAEKAVGLRQQAQKKIDHFAGQEAELMDQVEQLENELKTVTRERKKTEAYLRGQQAKVAELQRRLDEMDRIRAELEPYLDATYANLQEFVAQDLPFLKEERAQRLASLSDNLNDYDASLADKTRRLLEALAIEARYGSTVETEEGEIRVNDKLKRVRMLRLGRLGLFALSADGHSAWTFDKKTQSFEPVEGNIRGLIQAADIADRRRVVSLVKVPVGQPAKSSASGQVSEGEVAK
ncbi:DUF3450 domain-containing protein [Dethiosulfatarculus sandiegensis]|uniref:DUF3450 domain-containing protein n=1 Tax=Dethiosulfatarculus sandiegensis TaxID=1429043 RepID=A0A0D2I0R6_9BACT|nr:DUF3450 domain-containing protein [Dethiosulfatarculus sandiegensis]KIX16058.1 hypothetical protein X474_00805 [Dethiosulfatarculus sandiegensis]